MAELEHSSGGLELLETVKTARFDPIPNEDRAALAELVITLSDLP